VLAPEGQKIRAVFYANRAACHLELQDFKAAAKDCSSAIDIDGSYLKAWHRRAKAYEGLDDMDHALRDFQKVRFKASKCFLRIYAPPMLLLAITVYSNLPQRCMNRLQSSEYTLYAVQKLQHNQARQAGLLLDSLM